MLIVGIVYLLPVYVLGCQEYVHVKRTPGNTKPSNVKDDVYQCYSRESESPCTYEGIKSSSVKISKESEGWAIRGNSMKYTSDDLIDSVWKSGDTVEDIVVKSGPACRMETVDLDNKAVVLGECKGWILGGSSCTATCVYNHMTGENGDPVITCSAHSVAEVGKCGCKVAGLTSSGIRATAGSCEEHINKGWMPFGAVCDLQCEDKFEGDAYMRCTSTEFYVKDCGRYRLETSDLQPDSNAGRCADLSENRDGTLPALMDCDQECKPTCKPDYVGDLNIKYPCGSDRLEKNGSCEQGCDLKGYSCDNKTVLKRKDVCNIAASNDFGFQAVKCKRDKSGEVALLKLVHGCNITVEYPGCDHKCKGWRKIDEEDDDGCRSACGPHHYLDYRCNSNNISLHGTYLCLLPNDKLPDAAEEGECQEFFSKGWIKSGESCKPKCDYGLGDPVISCNDGKLTTEKCGVEPHFVIVAMGSTAAFIALIFFITLWDGSHASTWCSRTRQPRRTSTATYGTRYTKSLRSVSEGGGSVISYI